MWFYLYWISVILAWIILYFYVKKSVNDGDIVSRGTVVVLVLSNFIPVFNFICSIGGFIEITKDYWDEPIKFKKKGTDELLQKDE
jgi:hypothetical protein